MQQLTYGVITGWKDEGMTIDPMGREAWAQRGIDADESRATVSVAAIQDDVVHRYPRRPTVDGNSDDVVYISIPAAFLTAHDCVKIHAYVREMRRAEADYRRSFRFT